MPSRWTFGHLVALVELACGLFVAVWLFGVGLAAEAAGRSLLDRSFPFLLGVALGAGLVGLAVRSWRAASRESQHQPSKPSRPAATEPPTPAPPPSLSPEGQHELARVVAALAEAGVFAPHVPEPTQLSEAVADQGEPVIASGVLAAIAEASWYRPGFAESDHVGNLAFHPSHGEQFAEVLRAQIDDIVRLARGGLEDVSAVVELRDTDGTARVPTTVRIAVGEDVRVLDYAGAAKYLSTVLHVALAEVLRERGTERRLAWLWSDQGVWLSCLRDGEVERLNAALGHAAGDGWAWVDEGEPVAAGDVYPLATP